MNAPSTLPLATLHAMLEGLAAVGVDAAAVRREAELPAPGAAAPDEPRSAESFARLWTAARRLAPRETLATEVGLAVPFGAFGPLDYLAASSTRVDRAFEALGEFFRLTAPVLRVEPRTLPAGGGLVELVNLQDFPLLELSDEFTLGVLVGRFRRATGAFAIEALRLTRPPPPDPAAHEALLGAPVRFACTVTALELPAATWRAPLLGADPSLQRTLRALAAYLPDAPPLGAFEAELRLRLRALLPSGDGCAAEAARALGLSPRTLQRRLREEGTTFRAVLDEVREREAERLLAPGGPELTELALRLGFSDQTAWNRAFRRWKGVTPTQWRAGGSAPASPASGSPGRSAPPRSPPSPPPRPSAPRRRQARRRPRP